MECYLLSEPKIRRYRMCMLSLWLQKGMFWVSEQRLVNKANTICRNSWMTELEQLEKKVTGSDSFNDLHIWGYLFSKLSLFPKIVFKIFENFSETNKLTNTKTKQNNAYTQMTLYQFFFLSVKLWENLFSDSFRKNLKLFFKRK